MEKLQKYSKWALTFLSIWKVLVIFTIVMVGSMLFMCLLSTGSNPNAVDHINLDFLKFTTAPGTIAYLPRSILWVQVLYALTGFFTLYIISMLKKVVTPMSQGLPFDRQVGPTIRRIAWIQLIGDGISALLWMATEILTYFSFDFSTLFLNHSITGCSLSLNFSALETAVITFCVLFLLSYVFEYGQELQKLSDETL